MNNIIQQLGLDNKDWFVYGSYANYVLTQNNYLAMTCNDIDVYIVTDSNDVNDYTAIVDGTIIDVHYMSRKYFDEMKCGGDDPVLLEMMSYCFHDQFLTNMNEGFDTTPVDMSKLRHTISSTSSNSYVKAKKKLIVEDDYDKLSSMKSLYHSFRLLNYGCQIAEHGYVKDFYDKEMQVISDKILNVYEKSDIVDATKEELYPEYKKLKHRFKILCPQK